VTRLQREAEILASIKHPHIAAIHDLLEIQGARFLILEFVDGETLAERIARGPLSVDESIKVGFEIAEALEAAHEKGIVHRDLKPANIKLTQGGEVKVLDFGLAKVHDRPGKDLSNVPNQMPLSIPGTILGTPACDPRWRQSVWQRFPHGQRVYSWPQLIGN
jgi:eukaryotic-like serine/threonine-protein kinase